MMLCSSIRFILKISFLNVTCQLESGSGLPFAVIVTLNFSNTIIES